jgi:hypothetical protein
VSDDQRVGSNEEYRALRDGVDRHDVLVTADLVALTASIEDRPVATQYSRSEGEGAAGNLHVELDRSLTGGQALSYLGYDLAVRPRHDNRDALGHGDERTDHHRGRLTRELNANVMGETVGIGWSSATDAKDEGQRL